MLIAFQWKLQIVIKCPQTRGIAYLGATIILCPKIAAYSDSFRGIYNFRECLMKIRATVRPLPYQRLDSLPVVFE